MTKQPQFKSPLTQQVVLDPLNELLGLVLVSLKGVHGGVEPVLQVFGQVFGFQGRLLGIHDLGRQDHQGISETSSFSHGIDQLVSQRNGQDRLYETRWLGGINLS